jgi:mannose/fructose-specific phosphotransferase system component IIA
MPGLLIIAHAPLASSLKTVATHTFADCASRLEALDVPPDMAPDEIEARARELLERVRNPEAIIFTDVFGATPCNVAQRLADGQQVKVVAGVNVLAFEVPQVAASSSDLVFDAGLTVEAEAPPAPEGTVLLEELRRGDYWAFWDHG